MTRLLVTRVAVKGGPGSGNFGHAGRPGQVGGSAPGEGVEVVRVPGQDFDLGGFPDSCFRATGRRPA